jgi:hypothetical protein
MSMSIIVRRIRRRKRVLYAWLEVKEKIKEATLIQI